MLLGGPSKHVLGTAPALVSLDECEFVSSRRRDGRFIALAGGCFRELGRDFKAGVQEA